MPHSGIVRLILFQIALLFVFIIGSVLVGVINIAEESSGFLGNGLDNRRAVSGNALIFQEKPEFFRVLETLDLVVFCIRSLSCDKIKQIQ
jgi:hypothetical protein